jgi:hypothetical protein
MTELKPTKFGVTSNSAPTNKPDQFGQVHNNQSDSTAGNVPSGMESRLQHRQSDVDSGPKAQHHTLGTKRNQASPGNHVHDGTTSPKLGLYQMDPAGNKVVTSLSISGAKGGNAAVASIITLLKNFIDFTDNTTA